MRELRRTVYDYLGEILSVAFVLCAYMLTLYFLQHFTYRDSHGELRLPSLLIAFAPITIFYICIRFFFDRYLSVIFTCSVVCILQVANAKKIALTKEPLMLSDLNVRISFSVIKDYISVSDGILLIVILSVVGGGAFSA